MKRALLVTAVVAGFATGGLIILAWAVAILVVGPSVGGKS